MRKFYGQFEPSVDRFIFERYFPDENIKGIFVECGAYDGLTECSCKFFEETMGWKGYNLEPVPWIFEKLRTNRPHSTNLNFALSNTAGETNFKAVDHPQYGTDCTNGSLTHTAKHNEWLVENGCQFIEVPVKLLTWRDLIQQEAIAHIDLLVLDVEGHELFVLEGMKDCAVLPDVICIEIGHLDFNGIRETLKELGYVYDISSHVNAFFVKQELLPLFTLRRMRSRDEGSDNLRQELMHMTALHNEMQNACEALKRENEWARQQIAHFERTFTELQNSRAWKWIEKVRTLKSSFL